LTPLHPFTNCCCCSGRFDGAGLESEEVKQ
jgi:hypothetical protein